MHTPQPTLARRLYYPHIHTTDMGDTGKHSHIPVTSSVALSASDDVAGTWDRFFAPSVLEISLYAIPYAVRTEIHSKMQNTCQRRQAALRCFLVMLPAIRCVFAPDLNRAHPQGVH